MPREVYITGPASPTLADLTRACVRLHPELRVIDAGAYWRVLDADGQAVATVDLPRLVDDGRLAARVSGDTGTPGSVWWVEALVPWSTSADCGIEILQMLAADIRAELDVQDGR